MSEPKAADDLFPDCRLLLSAGTLVNAKFADRVAAAQSAGFDAISLFPEQYLAARRKEKLSVDTMREILAEYAIALDEVDPLIDWFAADASPSETLLVEMAEAFGARSVNVATAFVLHRSLAEITDHFGAVCQRLSRHGLRADLEFLPWTGVRNLSTALQIIDDISCDNAGAMFDLWHFFHSGEGLDVLRELTPQQAARITSLQLNDVPADIPEFTGRQKWLHIRTQLGMLANGIRVLGMDRFRKVALTAQYPHRDAQKMMQDTMCSRCFPGEGSREVAEVLSILSGRGVKPTVGIEVFNLDHHDLPADELAQRAMRSYKSIACA